MPAQDVPADPDRDRLTTAAVAAFLGLLPALFAGGLVTGIVDAGLCLAQGGWAWPKVHRFAAPFLPATLLVAALLAYPVGLYRQRWLRRGVVTRAGWLWTAAASAFLAVVVVLVWGVWGRKMQLPWSAALVVGSGVAAGAVGLALIIRRVRPGLALMLCGLGWTLFVATGAFRNAGRSYVLVPALALWMIVSAALPARWRRPLALGGLVVALVGLWGYGGDHAAKALISYRSIAAGPTAKLLRQIVDLDADGTSALLGGGDCDDFDERVNPHAIEVVGNRVDDNCAGGDLKRAVVPGDGERSPAEKRASRPDVVLLSLDAVRPDHVTAALMPHVHSFMRRGLHAPTSYTVAPYTGHAMIGAMTSTPAVDYDSGGRFFGMEPALSQVLGAVGYRSVAIHCLVDLPADMVVGFDFVDNSLGPICEDFRRVTSRATADLLLRHLKGQDRKGDGPLFLWAHFTDPHVPYAGGYAEELRRVDREVGRILRMIKRDTVVAILSDHGEAFGSHGFTGHIWRLDEELLRIVFAVAGPGVPQRRLARAVSIIDFAPTISDLVGAAVPDGWQGRSLLSSAVERPLVFESRYKAKVDLRGIRVGKYKITYDRKDNSYQLYDVTADPLDEVNLVEDRPDVFGRLRWRLGQVFDELYNNRRLIRKLRLLPQRPLRVPAHLGPMLRGNAQHFEPSR